MAVGRLKVAELVRKIVIYTSLYSNSTIYTSNLVTMTCIKLCYAMLGCRSCLLSHKQTPQEAGKLWLPKCGNWTGTVGHIHNGTLPKMKGRNLGGAVARRDSHFENPPYSTVSFTALGFVAYKRWSWLHHICRHYLFQGGHWKHPNLQINDRPSQPENLGIFKNPGSPCFQLPTQNLRCFWWPKNIRRIW